MPPIFNHCNITVDSFPQGVTQIQVETDVDIDVYEAPSTKTMDYAVGLTCILIFCPEGTILPNMEFLGAVKTQSEDSTYNYSALAYDYLVNDIAITGDFDITFASTPTPSNKISIGSLPLSKMFVGNVEVSKAILNGVTLYESAEKLDTPANVSVDGTEVTFDEVANAESYDILVDGNSIGEYTPQSGYTVTLTISKALYGEEAYYAVDGGEAQSFTQSDSPVVVTASRITIISVEGSGYDQYDFSINGGPYTSLIDTTDYEVNLVGDTTIDFKLEYD